MDLKKKMATWRKTALEQRTQIQETIEILYFQFVVIINHFSTIKLKKKVNFMLKILMVA